MVAIKRFFLYIFYYFNTSFNRKAIQLPTDEVTYIKAKVAQGWTPDTIMGGHSAVVCGRFTAFL